MYPAAAGGAGAPTVIFSEPRFMNAHAQRAISRFSARRGSPEHKSSRADVDMLPAHSIDRTEKLTLSDAIRAEIYFKHLARSGNLEEIRALCGKRKFLPLVLEEGAALAEDSGHASVQNYILSLWKFEKFEGRSTSGRPSFFEPLR